MAIEGDTERAVFFDTSDFGLSGTFTPSGGSSSTISGLFDSDYQLADLGGGVGVASADPRFVCRTVDVASAASGDALVVSSTTYTIRTVEDDGTGVTTLVLEV